MSFIVNPINAWPQFVRTEGEKFSISFSYFVVLKRAEKRELTPVKDEELIALMEAFMTFKDGEIIEENNEIIIPERLCEKYSFNGEFNPEGKCKYV